METDRLSVARGVPALRLSAMYGAYFAYVGAHSPYLSLYLQSIGQAAWEIGVVLAAMQLARVLAPSFWAALAERGLGVGRLLPICIGLGAIAFFGLFSVTSFMAVLALLAVHAFCSGGAIPMVEVITLTSLGAQTARYGAIRVWGSIGFMAAVLLLGLQLDRWPIETLLVSVAATIVLSFFCALALRDSGAGLTHQRGALAPILARPRVRALLLASFCMSVAHAPVYSFFSVYLDNNGYSKLAIGWLWTVGVIAEIIVFTTQTRWAGRVSIEAVFWGSLACAVVRFVLIGWGIHAWPSLIIAQILHGATFGSFHVAALALIHREFAAGTQVRGQAIFMSVSYGAGGMVGALLSGLAWESIGPAWTYTGATVVAALALIAALSIRGIRSATVSAVSDR
jgi:MFS transporter, PPP family, 3-phenylpropionic acid transporter